MHHKGVHHRNLKPDNILITKEEEVKIADFSMSRIMTVPHVAYTPEDPKERERSGREARRLWYRAPELLFRKNIYSTEIDIWSVGCLLAEISTGEPIFNGETEVEQLFKIFKLFGTPEDEVLKLMKNEGEASIHLPKWQSVDITKINCEKDSEDFKKLLSTYLPTRETSLIYLLEMK